MDVTPELIAARKNRVRSWIAVLDRGAKGRTVNVGGYDVTLHDWLIDDDRTVELIVSVPGLWDHETLRIVNPPIGVRDGEAIRHNPADAVAQVLVSIIEDRMGVQ